MQPHRQATAIGAILLVITYMLNQHHQQNASTEFNYAYVTGAAMLVAFMISFFFFHKKRKDS